MTTSKKAIIIAIAFSILLTFGYAQKEGTDNETIEAPVDVPVTMATSTPETPKKIEPKATTTREQWLSDLIECESNGNPEAVNPKDRDGTPSYGLLQFKPSTFELFSKAYVIEGNLMDPEAQKAIVIRMMDDESVVWEVQFPACVRRLGRPPRQ